MVLDAWLPIGFELPDGAVIGKPLFGGPDWQIVETEGSGRALLVQEDLAQRWIEAGLVASQTMHAFEFGNETLYSLSSGPGQTMAPVEEADGPRDKSEAVAFAVALKATREVDPSIPVQDGLYVEKISRLLPTFSISPETPDDVVLGFWLTGGARVSVHSFRRLHQLTSWLDAGHLKQVVEAGGFEVGAIVPGAPKAEPTDAVRVSKSDERGVTEPKKRRFELAGRPELESFINEYVVDIVLNPEQYEALGVGFPGGIVLHGPPGTGKTFAIERLTEFLGWPSYQIDASSVASPYIHDTAKKVSQVFDQAMDNAPSVLVIDEMEAFLPERSASAGQSYRVEEVAEFLRRIPEAADNNVLVVAMTNRIDMVDPAILRRGRFDHVIEVGYASEEEVHDLLEKLLAKIPIETDVDPAPLARELAGRPLSDAAFVVREGARLAARAGRDRLDQESLMTAAEKAPSRDGQEEKRRIGFV